MTPIPAQHLCGPAFWHMEITTPMEAIDRLRKTKARRSEDATASTRCTTRCSSTNELSNSTAVSQRYYKGCELLPETPMVYWRPGIGQSRSIGVIVRILPFEAACVLFSAGAVSTDGRFVALTGTCSQVSPPRPSQRLDQSEPRRW